VKAEGWERNAKYRTVPEHMMCLRAATWFIRRQYPDVLLGYRPADELEDMEIAAVAETKQIQEAAENRYSPAPRVVEVEAEPVEDAPLEFVPCKECMGEGCIICKGTGEVAK